MSYKHWLIVAAIAAGAMAAGVYARGYSDAKGWTAGTL
jgi:hypothetical protein